MTEPTATALPFKMGDWSVEPTANRLVCADREVQLEPKVMRVLVYLMERGGELLRSEPGAVGNEGRQYYKRSQTVARFPTWIAENGLRNTLDEQ